MQEALAALEMLRALPSQAVKADLVFSGHTISESLTEKELSGLNRL
jgi:hypothetical protein